MSADLNKYNSQKHTELLKTIEEFRDLYKKHSFDLDELSGKKVYFPGSTGDLPSINGDIQNVKKRFNECESKAEIDITFNYYYASYYNKLLDIKKRISEYQKQKAIVYGTVKTIPATGKPNTREFNNNIGQFESELKLWSKSQETKAYKEYRALQNTQHNREMERRRLKRQERLRLKRQTLKSTAVSKPSSSHTASSQLSRAQQVAQRISRRVSNSQRARSNASSQSSLKSRGRFRVTPVNKAMGKRSIKRRRSKSKAKRTHRRSRRSRR